MSYHRTSTPAASEWRETHNANARNGAGVYRRPMSGPIIPMTPPSFWERFWGAKR